MSTKTNFSKQTKKEIDLFNAKQKNMKTEILKQAEKKANKAARLKANEFAAKQAAKQAEIKQAALQAAKEQAAKEQAAKEQAAKQPEIETYFYIPANQINAKQPNSAKRDLRKQANFERHIIKPLQASSKEQAAKQPENKIPAINGNSIEAAKQSKQFKATAKEQALILKYGNYDSGSLKRFLNKTNWLLSTEENNLPIDLKKNLDAFLLELGQFLEIRNALILEFKETFFAK